MICLIGVETGRMDRITEQEANKAVNFIINPLYKQYYSFPNKKVYIHIYIFAKTKFFCFETGNFRLWYHKRMEKALSRDELLIQLLEKARNPFTTCEQKEDILTIMKDSSNFKGKNHIFLLQCYFNPVDPLFIIDEKEALRQGYLALKENNPYSCYYLYLLLKDKEPSKARNYLRLCCDSAYPEAYLEMAKCQHKGILFEENREKAFENYKKAAKCGLYEGYYGMFLMASEDGDYPLQKTIIEEAEKRGFHLPGIIE